MKIIEDNTLFKLILIAFDIILILFLILNLIQILNYDYKESVIYLSYPSIYKKDLNSNKYIVDSSSRRVIKADKNNNLIYIINGGTKVDNSFYQVVDIEIDKNENLYILNSQLDENGFYVNKITLLKYNKNGKFEKIIYEKKYRKEELSNLNVQRSLYKNLFYKNGKIYFYLFENRGVKEYEYNIDLEKIYNKYIFNFDKANIFINNIYFDSFNNYFFITKRGEIFNYKNGELFLIYKEKNSLPYYIIKIDEEIFFSDLLKKNIVRMLDGKNFLLFLENQTRENNINLLNYYYNINTSDNFILLLSDKYCFDVDKDGNVKYFFDSINNNPFNIYKYYFLIVLEIILFLTFLFCLYKTYKIVLNGKFSIFLKMFLIFIPFITISVFVTFFIVYEDLINRYEKLLNNKIATMIQIISRSIDYKDLKNLNYPEDFMSESYLNLNHKIMNLLNFNRDEWNKDFYFAIHKKIDDYIYTIMYLNYDVTVKTPFDYLNEPNSIYTRSYEGQILIEKSIDQWGNWFYGVGPIYDENNNIMGLIEIGKDNTAFENSNKELIKKGIRDMTILSLIFIFILFFILYYLLISIKKLKEGTQLIEQGKWEIQVKIKGNDEIEDLANSFNKMVNYVNKYLTEITNLNKVYFKFVPEEFIKILNKQNIVDIKLGDQVQKEMTIMFLDIVGFTEISEKLTPTENFNFLNSYLSVVGPLVRKNNGFIDKYLGDGIMALYPNSVDDALESAIEIRKVNIEFNKKQLEKGYPEIDVRFGINNGVLMLGILGEEQRVDSTVISDNVNLASRLEGLTRKFGTAIIISESAYEKIKRKEIYVFRYLGKVRVKGKKNPIKIYEVVDGLKNEEKIKKIKYIDSFYLGVNYFEKFEYNKALALFNKILEVFPEDMAVRFYIDICNYYIKENLKENVIIFYDK